MLSSRLWSARHVLPAGLVVGAGLVAISACSQVLGIKELENAVDAGPEATPEAGPFVCKPDHPPERGASGDGDGPALILAFNNISGALEQTIPADFGWDLDGHCTCQDKTTPESCVRPNPNALETCDGLNGRDLAGNLALKQATNAVTQISDSNLKTKIEAGKFGAVVVIRGYDGSLNDSKVRVDFAPSYGTVKVGDGGTAQTDGSGKLVPVALKHDGTDRWSWVPAMGTANAGLFDAVARDDDAYVRGGVMVAHFKVAYVVVQFEVTNNNPLTFRVDDVVVSANVVETGKGIELTNGRIGGRASISTMMRAFGAWTDFFPDGDLCDGAAGYDVLRGGLCRNRDIRGSAADDHKNLPCDAISFGIGFAAEPALLYGPADYPYKKTTCFNGTVPLDIAPGDVCQ